MHQPLFAGLLAAAPPPVPNGETTVPNALLVVVVGLLLLAILDFVNKHLPRYKKIDDVLRVIVAILGVVVPGSTLPFVRDIFTILPSLVQAGIDNSNAKGWAIAGLSVITLGVAALGIYMFFNAKRSTKAAIWLMVITGWIFLGLPWVQEASTWFVNNVEIGFCWGFFMGMYRYAAQHHLKLS